MTVLLHRSDDVKSRSYIRQSSRARRSAASLSSQQNSATYVNIKHQQRHLPFNMFKPRPPLNIASLPYNNVSTIIDDHVSNVTTSHRGVWDGGYARHFEQPPSDEHDSTQIDEGYSRRLIGHNNEDDVSSITRFQLRPGRFGGIPPSNRNEFGLLPTTLLTGDANRHGYLTTTDTADDVETSNRRIDAFDSNESYARYLGRHDDNDGYTRHLSRHDNDEDGASSVTGFQLRPGRFGGISQRYRREFGRGLSTLLTGSNGFLTSSIAAEEIETNR